MADSTHIVCPGCDAINRIPAARLDGIRSIPTLVLFRQGRELARQAGAMGAADIVRWVSANL